MRFETGDRVATPHGTGVVDYINDTDGAVRVNFESGLYWHYNRDELRLLDDEPAPTDWRTQTCGKCGFYYIPTLECRKRYVARETMTACPDFVPREKP